MKKTSMITIFLFLSTFILFSQYPPKSGVGLRISSFGVPSSVLDSLDIYEHPKITGTSVSFEIRTYGSKGPRSAANWIFSFEYSRMGGEGPWKEKKEHRGSKNAYGEVIQLNLSATVLINFFPKWVVHPYIGFGLGAGRGSYWYEGIEEDEIGVETKKIEKGDLFVPVAHLPIGIVGNISDKVEIRLEGGFKNGFYLGMGVVYYY